MGKLEVGFSYEKCRILLHMHTRTCMCGALCDLRAAFCLINVDKC